jgi:hypothetical protein
MAAVTPATLTQFSVGDLKGYYASFADTTDTGDTWASGIPGIVAVFASQGGAVTTQASAGAGASFSGSTVTIYLGEDDTAVNLLVLARS